MLPSGLKKSRRQQRKEVAVHLVAEGKLDPYAKPNFKETAPTAKDTSGRPGGAPPRSTSRGSGWQERQPRGLGRNKFVPDTARRAVGTMQKPPRYVPPYRRNSAQQAALASTALLPGGGATRGKADGRIAPTTKPPMTSADTTRYRRREDDVRTSSTLHRPSRDVCVPDVLQAIRILQAAQSALSTAVHVVPVFEQPLLGTPSPSRRCAPDATRVQTVPDVPACTDSSPADGTQTIVGGSVPVFEVAGGIFRCVGYAAAQNVWDSLLAGYELCDPWLSLQVNTEVWLSSAKQHLLGFRGKLLERGRRCQARLGGGAAVCLRWLADLGSGSSMPVPEIRISQENDSGPTMARGWPYNPWLAE